VKAISVNHQAKEIKNRLTKLFHSRRNVVIGISVVAIIVLVSSGIYALSLKGQVSDTDKANDLAKIETAVIAGLNKNNHLPESLHLEYLGLTNLKGNIDDYSYTPDPHEDGSPTWAYTTCTTFHTQTIKLPIEAGTEGFTSGGTGAQAYMSHRKGKQCFSNSYYKGSSHVGLVYNKGEVTAPKVTLNDAQVSDFVTESEKYYLAQREAFGSPGALGDLKKNCIKTKSQDTLYKDPFGNLYSCKVFYDSTVQVSGSDAHITSLLNTFVITAKSEGFGVQDTTYPANPDSSGSLYAYRWLEGFGGGKFGCKFDTTYVMKIAQTEIEYRYACALGQLKNLPSDFTVVSELTGP
jgi:hypothetical protein